MVNKYRLLFPNRKQLGTDLHMDFERLRYLAALSRSGSVRSAAAALHVTPGAVSKGIAKLEDEVGTALIAHSGRGVVLTQDGTWLARRAEHLVGEHASLRTDLASRKAREAGLGVATYDVFVEWFPALLARQFLPRVPLAVRERYPGEIESSVATREADVGITWTPVATDGVTHRDIARVKLGVFVARGAFPDIPTLELPFALPIHPVKGATSQHGPLDGWPEDAPPRDARYLTSALEARLALAREGQAAIVLPMFVAERHNSVVLATHRLELRPLPRSYTRLARTVSVVASDHPTELMRGRTESVIAALRAVCT